MNPITEEWLRDVGFKWSQLDRQPEKHWLLWIAPACIDPIERDGRMFAATEDLGIELGKGRADGPWSCWVRADYAGRYSRFVHIRNVVHQEEVIQLIEAMTGRVWDPKDVLYGALRSPEESQRLREDSESLHQRLARGWGERVERELGLDKDKQEIMRP